MLAVVVVVDILRHRQQMQELVELVAAVTEALLQVDPMALQIPEVVVAVAVLETLDQTLQAAPAAAVLSLSRLTKQGEA